MLPRTVFLLIFYLQCQKDVHRKKSVATSEQVCCGSVCVSVTSDPKGLAPEPNPPAIRWFLSDKRLEPFFPDSWWRASSGGCSVWG